MRTKDISTTYRVDTEEQILEAAERILRKRLERQGRIKQPGDAANYLRAYCAHLEYEVFGCVFLDAMHQILAIETLFRGTVDSGEVHPREVAKRALALNASSIICFHNHPSGNLDASAADRAVTARLKQAMSLIDVRLLDHFIVSAQGHMSMASLGWV
jgi:DNA repair protein RadC